MNTDQTDQLQLIDAEETIIRSRSPSRINDSKIISGAVSPKQQVYIKDFNKLNFERSNINRQDQEEDSKIINQFLEFDFTQNEENRQQKLPTLTSVLEEDGLLNPPNQESQPELLGTMPLKNQAERGSAGPSSLYSSTGINFIQHHAMDTERNALKNPRLNEHSLPDNKTSAGKQSNAFMFATGALKSDRVQMKLQKGEKVGRHRVLPDETYQNIKYRNQIFDVRAGMPKGSEKAERDSQITSVSKAVDSLLNQYEKEFNLPDQRTDYSPFNAAGSAPQEGSDTMRSKDKSSARSPGRLPTTRQSQKSHNGAKAGTTSREMEERQIAGQIVGPWKERRQLIKIEGTTSSGRNNYQDQNQDNIDMTGNLHSTQFQQTPASQGMLSPQESNKNIAVQGIFKGYTTKASPEQKRVFSPEPLKVVYSQYRGGSSQVPILNIAKAPSPKNQGANQKQLQKQILEKMSLDFQQSMKQDKNGVGKLYQSLGLPKDKSQASDFTDPLTFRDKHPKRKNITRGGPRQLFNNTALYPSAGRNAQTTLPGKRNRPGTKLLKSIRDEASALLKEEQIEAAAGTLTSTKQVGNLDLSRAVHVWNQSTIQQDTERRKRRMKGEQTPPCKFQVGRLTQHTVTDNTTRDDQNPASALLEQRPGTQAAIGQPLETFQRPFSQQPEQPRGFFSSKTSARPETHDLNLRRHNIFSQQQRERIQRFGGQGLPNRDGLSGNSNWMPHTAKHFGAHGEANEPDLGFAQNWPLFHQLKNSNLLSQSLNLNGLISIQGAIEQQIAKKTPLETKRKFNQRNKLSLSVANRDDFRGEEPKQKMDTNCQTDGLESTRNSMHKTQHSKWAQQSFRNEQGSRLINQQFKIKTVLSTKRGKDNTEKRFGIQGSAISKMIKEEEKLGIAAVSVPQVKNSLDDIIDLKIDQELESILVKSKIQEEDVANGGEESFRRRKTITVRGYPLTATPLEMSKVEITKVNPVKEEQPPSRREQVPKNLGSYRTSQASCHSGAQDLKQKFSIHQSDQQGYTSRKIDDRTNEEPAAEKEKTPTERRNDGKQEPVSKAPKGKESGDQKTEPQITEGNFKKDTSVSGPKFLSDQAQKEPEDTRIRIREELASDTAEPAGANSRGRETNMPAEHNAIPSLDDADPFLQSMTFERKQEFSGTDQKLSPATQEGVPEIAPENLQDRGEVPNCKDSSQRRSLLVNQSVLDSARSRNQSQGSQGSRVNGKENPHHYQIIKDYISIQYQKYEREGSPAIANHAKMVPPARALKNSSFTRYQRGHKRAGTYQLSDRYSIDPFSTQEDPRSNSPNLLRTIALAQSPSAKIEKDSAKPQQPSGRKDAELGELVRNSAPQRTPYAEGQPPYEIEPRKGATTREEKEVIMNKIQVRDGRVKQREPTFQINNADLAGLQNPDYGKVEDGKKFKIRKQIIVSPGGNAKIRNDKIPRKVGVNSIDVSKLKNYEIIQNTVGSGSLQNPSTSRLQNLNSQRTDRSPQKSVEQPTLSVKSKEKEKTVDDPQTQRARQFMESKIKNFKKSLRMSIDNKIDYQNQPKLYKKRFIAVNRRSIQAQKQGNGTHRKQVRQIYYSLHRQMNRVRQSIDQTQLDDISLLEMGQMNSRVKNISKLSPIRDRNHIDQHNLLNQNIGFLSPPYNLANFPNTLNSSNSDVKGAHSFEDSASIGSKEANLFILMPLSHENGNKRWENQKIEDQFIKKRKIQGVPMNESEDVKNNREKQQIMKQLGKKYYKKFIKKIDDTDVLEIVMEQGRSAPVSQLSQPYSQITSQLTQEKPDQVTQVTQKNQETNLSKEQVKDLDDSSKLHTALAKYEDTASFQKQFLSQQRSINVDTMYLQDSNLPSRNQITITNNSVPKNRSLIKSFDSHQLDNDKESQLNNDLLHIKQVKKFNRRQNARKLTSKELKNHAENCTQMQQLLNYNLSNSSHERGKVHNVPELNLIMELDQNVTIQSKRSEKYQQTSSRVKSQSDTDQNSPEYIRTVPQNPQGQCYNAVIIPLSPQNQMAANQIIQTQNQNSLELNPVKFSRSIGTGFVPLKQNQYSSNQSAADSPMLYGESPIMSQAFIDKQAIRYTYQTMEQCMQKRKLEGKNQITTLPISVNTQTVNANTMTITKKNSITIKSNDEYLTEDITNFQAQEDLLKA